MSPLNWIDGLMGSLLGIVIWTIVAVVAFVWFVYKTAGTSIFGTTGHLSSEFKLVVFFNLTMVLGLWLSRLEAVASDGTVSLGASLVIVALILGAAYINARYIDSRAIVKASKTTSDSELSAIIGKWHLKPLKPDDKSTDEDKQG